MKKLSKIWWIVGAVVVTAIIIITVVVINNNNDDTTGGSSSSTSSAYSQLKIGDFVDYKAPSGNSYTIETTTSGIDKAQIIEVTGKEVWRVLGIEDGEIALVTDGVMVSKYGDRFEFKGQTGYNNAITTIDDMAKIYQNDLSRDARSLRLSDLLSKINLEKMAEAVQNKMDNDVDASGDYRAVYDSACRAMNTNYGVNRTIGSVTETINNCFSINYTTSTYSLTSFLDNPVYEELFSTTYGNDQVTNAFLADNIVSIRDNSFLNQLFFSYSLPQYTIYPGKGSSFMIGGFDSTDWYQYDEAEGVRNPATGRGAIKPVVVLKSSVKVTGGDGSTTSPWTLSE